MLSPALWPISSPSHSHLLQLLHLRMRQRGEGCPAARSVNTATRAALGAGGGWEQVTEMQPRSWCGEECGLRLQCWKVFRHP